MGKVSCRDEIVLYVSSNQSWDSYYGLGTFVVLDDYFVLRWLKFSVVESTPKPIFFTSTLLNLTIGLILKKIYAFV